VKKVLGGLAAVILLLALSLPVLAGQDKVVICHAAGLDGTTKYVTLELAWPAVYGEAGHFYENGTPRAGHEQDYLGACKGDEPSPTPTSTPTSTSSPTPSVGPTATPTPSAEPTSTPTASPSPTVEPSPSFTSSPSSTPNLTPPPTDTEQTAESSPNKVNYFLFMLFALPIAFAFGYFLTSRRLR